MLGSDPYNNLLGSTPDVGTGLGQSYTKETFMSIAESFGRSGFARFINSPAGRITRIVAGIVLIGWGYTQLTTVTGLALIIVGLVPLVAGALDLCLISALLGGPISGKRIRGSKP